MSSAAGRLWQELQERSRAAFDWWLAELRELLPRRAGRIVRRAPVALEFGGATPALRVHGTGGGAPLRLPIDPAAPEQAASQVHAALRQAGRGTAITIELQPEAVLETGLSLPRAAERALRPILLNQLERVVPLPPEQVEFAYAVEPRRPADATLQVRLAVATRAGIGQALDMARRLRLRPEQVVAGAGGRRPPLVLWRAGAQGGGSAMGRRVRHFLELGTIGLLAAAFITYLVRLDQQAESQQALIAERMKLADAAMKLAKERDAAEAALRMLEERRDRPTPLVILDELTQLVPSDTWLSRLKVQDDNVEIVGVSPNVSALVDRLNRDPLLENPRFASPITATEDGRAQRFDLSMTIEGEEGQ